MKVGHLVSDLPDRKKVGVVVRFAGRNGWEVLWNTGERLLEVKRLLEVINE